MKITEETVLQIIYKALDNLNQERDEADQVPLDPETRLFGSKSALDSLALVSVIADVEMDVSDEVGEAVSLTDDRALNQEHTPFASVRRLTQYILDLVNGAGE